MYEGDDLNTLDDAPPPEESGNKTFLWGTAILGGFLFLSLLCFGGYYWFGMRPQITARDVALKTKVAIDVAVGQGLTATAMSDMLSQAAMASPTLAPTDTPVFQQATATLAPVDPQTATVAAALTQAAQAQLTVTGLPVSAALPKTGFMDEVGAPGLAVMAMALVIVILLARRLRVSPAK